VLPVLAGKLKIFHVPHRKKSRGSEVYSCKYACCQQSEKTVIARQRLVEICFRYNGNLKYIFMANANNKGKNYCACGSLCGPLEASSGWDTESRGRVRGESSED
jgi:hypothetical protein